MNVKSLSIFAGLIAAFAGTHAMAADEYTRNQNLPTAYVSTAPHAAVRVAAVDEFQRNQYAAAVVPSTLQRAQVVAEAIEARKLGLISEGDQFKQPTAEQAEQIRLAGLKAVNSQVASR
jgi:hypothetical protein